MARRIVLLLGIAVIAVLIGLLSIWLYIGRAGGSGLEDWIGRQIVGVLENYITPKVAFDTLDYQAPRTVIVQNLSLTSENRPILRIDRARLELAEIPRRGKPILVQQIELQTPRLQLITKTRGGLVGWTDFVRDKAIEDPESVPPGQRLSDVLVLRHVGIHEGEVLYEDRVNGAERMVLPGINMRLETPPIQGESGWYQLAGRLQRDPLLDLQVDGSINLDTGLLQLSKLELAASLSERQYQTVPPSLQKFLRRHEIQGALTATAQGEIPLDNPGRLKGTLRASLQDGRIRYAGMVMPVKAVRIDARVPDGKIDVSVAGINLAAEDQTFFSIDEITAQLAGIPAQNQPLVIERVQVSRPHLTFATRAKRGLKGWSELAELPSTGQGSQEQATQADVSEALRAVHLRECEIKQGAVTYRPAGHQQPLSVEEIDVHLATSPQEGSPDVLQVAGQVQAGALMKADLRGRLNTRTAALEVEEFKAGTTINQDSYTHFPREAADWLAKHQFQGQLTAKGRGRIALYDFAQSDFQVSAGIASARMEYDQVRIPLGSARLQFKMPGRHIEASLADLKLVYQDQPFLTLGKMNATGRLNRAAGELDLERLRLEQPAVNLLRQASGEFIGWSQLGRNRPQSSPQAPALSPGTFLDKLRVGQLELADARFSYSGPGVTGPLVLQGIDAHLQTSTSPGRSTLSVSGEIRQPAVFSIDLAAQYNPERSAVEFSKFVAKADINEETLAQVPRPMQDSLQRQGIRGSFAVNWKGNVPLGPATRWQGRLQATAQNARFTYGGLVWPVEQLQINARAEKGVVSAPFAAGLLGGKLKGDFQASMPENRAFSLTWNVTNLRLGQLVQAAQQKQSEYAGIVQSQGKLQGRFGSAKSLGGSGKVTIAKGELMQLPIIRSIFVKVLTIPLGIDRPRSDEGRMAWKFRPDRLQVSELAVASPLLTLEGNGKIYYDGRLDLNVAAEPMQRIPSVLGKVGELLEEVGKVGSKVVTYQVGGTLSDPKVTPVPLGLSGK